MTQAVSLKKGGNVSLAKVAPALKKLVIGLGWSARTTDGAPFDLDASLFVLNENGVVDDSNDFIFYNNLKSVDGSIVHNGDNRTGEGDGDDESVSVSLDAVPAGKKTLSLVVTIHDAEARKQSFGDVNDAYIRLVNEETGEEVARFDLTEDAGTETAMIFGQVYRHNGEWKFRAVGQGFAGGLAAACQNYGISTEA